MQVVVNSGMLGVGYSWRENFQTSNKRDVCVYVCERISKEEYFVFV